jgi:hypothetical protein
MKKNQGSVGKKVGDTHLGFLLDQRQGKKHGKVDPHILLIISMYLFRFASPFVDSSTEKGYDGELDGGKEERRG